MRKKLLLLLIGFCLLLFLGFMSCCDDCPTCPKEEEPELGNYRLYAADGMNQFLMSVDIPADTIIDSIRLDYYPSDVFVTPDGGKVIVVGGPTHVYNTADLSSIEMPVKAGLYYFDGSDNYGALVANKLYFIDPINLTPYDSLEHPGNIDINLGQYFLDTVTDRFFESIIRWEDTTNAVYLFDCRTRTLTDSIIFPQHLGAFLNIAYNWLTNDLYIISLYNSTYSFFYQYDIDADSMISPLPLILRKPYGSIAISPDGTRVYLTDSGHGMFGEPPIHPIWVIDALINQPICWIPNYDSAGVIAPFFGQIILTPDNRWAYIGSNSSSGGGVPVAVVDRQVNKIVRRISPYLAFSSRIAIGPIP
ncbi:MAG: hypothetical protein AB1746_15350 [Candidatus Zixiibacteriota bacterium]